MKQEDVKKGLRVKVVKVDHEDQIVGIKLGDMGTVLEDKNDEPFVRMDKYNSDFSDAMCLCEYGHGKAFPSIRIGPLNELEDLKQKRKELDKQQEELDKQIKELESKSNPVELEVWGKGSYISLAGDEDTFPAYVYAENTRLNVGTKFRAELKEEDGKQYIQFFIK